VREMDAGRMQHRPVPNAGIEEATVNAFFSRAKRERFLTLLRNPKRRDKALNALNHFSGFDERFITSLGTKHDDLAGVLRARGAADACYVISDLGHIDARVMRLEDAIDETVIGGFGSILCCIPGELALFIGEAGTGAYLLLQRPRPASPTPAR
jgi:hypothetical protein